MRWAIVLVRDGGENPIPWPGWYVTEGREVLTLECERNAIREGQRLLDVYRGQATCFYVKRYEATSAGEHASCQGPDLFHLSGWLP